MSPTIIRRGVSEIQATRSTKVACNGRENGKIVVDITFRAVSYQPLENLVIDIPGEWLQPVHFRLGMRDKR